jgi:hypothetical protein
MNPSLSYYLAAARVAELHHQAQRDMLAHAARQARSSRSHQPASRFPAAGRHLRTVLGPSRSRAGTRVRRSPGVPR